LFPPHQHPNIGFHHAIALLTDKTVMNADDNLLVIEQVVILRCPEGKPLTFIPIGDHHV
jgi:hypothetical protein